MEETSNIDQIIFSYLAGKSDIEEVQALRKWLHASPHHKKQFDIVKSYWESNRWEIEVDGKDMLFDRLKQKIRSEDTPVRPIKYRSEMSGAKSYRYRMIGIAASLILLISIGMFLFETEPLQSDAVEEVATIAKQNPAGQKSRITLPDGTLVWLNSESEISYPERFDAGQRNVVMRGEAYFEVAKDPRKPFIVHTNKMNVRVLGTCFNVKSYAGDPTASVSLVEGKVRVDFTDRHKLKREAMLLEPGDELIYSLKGSKLNKQNFDREYVTSWKDGVLILKNDSFAALKEKLERWYGIRIHVEGVPPADFIVKGRFDNEYLDNVLRTLQFGRDFGYAIHDNIAVITFN
ncbi:MAG: FecR domain-containing protein [Cytophagales bacterium]|nr:FecR domain-containing protein [Cytophagales bacterium]